MHLRPSLPPFRQDARPLGEVVQGVIADVQEAMDGMPDALRKLNLTSWPLTLDGLKEVSLHTCVSSCTYVLNLVSLCTRRPLAPVRMYTLH